MNAPALRHAADRRPIALLAAMEEEVRALMPQVHGGRTTAHGRAWTRTGELAGTPVVLACTGAGAEAAAHGVGALLASHDVGQIMIVGLSGALTDDLEPGSLLVARSVVDARSGAPREILPAPSLPPSLAVRATEGAALTVRAILGPEEKARARALAPEGPVAVDLETAVWARAAAERGIPYVVVRAISDGASEELPLDFERCRRSDGTIDRGRVLRRALARPAALPGLWRMKRRVDLCSERLADRVVAWVEESRS